MKKTVVCVVLCAALLMMSVVPMVSAEDNYVISDSYLTVGAQEYAVDAAYPYTVYIFSPSEVGDYTFTCEQALIGIVSYNDMWVMMEPSDTNVNAHTVQWSCTAVGQGIMVAVASQTASVTIGVTLSSGGQTQVVEWTYYENQVAPQSFTLPVEASAMLTVNIDDETVDTAVLGQDGYYHLNREDGEVLYVCLNDSKMSLKSAAETGQLKEVLTDESGEIIAKTDFNEAFGEYLACADAQTALYPLTVDLIEMFKRVGAHHGWYVEGGFVGGVAEDAWMFACRYVKAPLKGDLNADDAVNLTDAAQLFYAVNGTQTLGADQQAVADLNGDGAVNLADAARLFYMISGAVQ